MTRKEEREILFQNVFEFLFSRERKNLDIEFIKNIYEKVCDNFDEIETMLKSALKDFSYSQIFKADLAILMTATAEIKFEMTPTAVAINEALEIAKKYSTEKSPAFINGVLSSLVKTLGDDNEAN